MSTLIQKVLNLRDTLWIASEFKIKYTNLDKYDIPGDNGIKIKLTVKKT